MDDYQNTLNEAKIYKKKPTQIIDLICNGIVTDKNVPQNYRTIFNKRKDVDFCNFIKTIISLKGNPIEPSTAYNHNLLALYEMFERKDKWIRDISTWKRKSYNTERQLISISKHLFCKYDIPTFMNNAWLSRGRRRQGHSGFKNNWIDWFIHLGQGGNIRTANVPVQLTKKMAFNFLQAPDNYTPDNAFRWAQIHGLNGDESLVKSILESKIGESFNNDIFWSTVIHFFVRNPMIDSAQISPIVDYINHLKYDISRIQMAGGLYTYRAKQPNFKIEGRTVESLIRGMEAWHKELGKHEKRNRPTRWDGIDVNDSVIKVGKDKNVRVYIFKQLLTAKELREEGSTHNHCVGSYSQSCSNGRTSIWSLSVDDWLGVNKPLVTIELNREYNVTQIRGKNNRKANSVEMNLIQKWVTNENLKFSRWI